MKRFFRSLKQQPMISIITIAGTALAIFLIMTVMTMEEVKFAPFSPENNRDRWLMARSLSIGNKDWGENDTSNGCYSFTTIKRVYYPMTTPEKVTALTECYTANLSVNGGNSISTDLRETDGNFWEVMDFNFVAGKPYTQTDFDSALPVAVISESTARRLYNTTDVVGKTFNINFVEYRIVGVVKDVTTLATSAYAQAWIPFSTSNVIRFSWLNDIMGSLQVIILARDKGDFPAIRDEYNKRFEDYEKEIGEGGFYVVHHNRPYTQEKQAYNFSSNYEVDMKDVKRELWIIYLILLIVPAINLSAMTQSRLAERREETGVRRAFGARRSAIMKDLFLESLMVTLIAGVIGLVASIIFGILASDFLFTAPYSSYQVSVHTSVGILFNWHTFWFALGICFLLNLISASWPSWRASRTNIVLALQPK